MCLLTKSVFQCLFLACFIFNTLVLIECKENPNEETEKEQGSGQGGLAAGEYSNFYSYNVTDIDGEVVNLEKYRGKVIKNFDIFKCNFTMLMG